jgi:hypothetical protein
MITDSCLRPFLCQLPIESIFLVLILIKVYFGFTAARTTKRRRGLQGVFRVDASHCLSTVLIAIGRTSLRSVRSRIRERNPSARLLLLQPVIIDVVPSTKQIFEQGKGREEWTEERKLGPRGTIHCWDKCWPVSYMTIDRSRP